MAAAKGNQYAVKERIWTAAIHRALERRSKSRKDKILEIDALADALIERCLERDMQAIREFGDRMEGKARQQLEVLGDADNPMHMRIEQVIIDAK